MILGYPRISPLSSQATGKNTHFTPLLEPGGRIFPLVEPKIQVSQKFYGEGQTRLLRNPGLIRRLIAEAMTEWCNTFLETAKGGGIIWGIVWLYKA